MDIEIKALSTERKEDYLSFFESVEFEEHPHWANCYCYSYHFTGTAEQWIKDKNRNCVSSMIDQGSMKGYLAYIDGQPVGWCNANNRLNYQLLTKTFDLVDPEHPKICSIVCFLVHPDFRRRGILQLLLDRIIKDYTALGYEFVEVYPRIGKLSEEKLYRGPEHTYLRYGFEIVRSFEEYQLMRLKL